MLGGLLLWYSVQVLREESAKRAMRLFTWSITYLTALFVANYTYGWIGLQDLNFYGSAPELPEYK